MISTSSILGLQMLYGVHQLHLNDQQAYVLFAATISLMFAAPVVGGYIGGRHLLPTHCTYIGLVLSITGMYAMCLGSACYFYAGLGTFIIGNGLTLANLFVLLGRLLPEGDHKRDSGFTFCYIGMSLGSFVALLFSSFIAVTIGYHFTYLACACFLVIALFIMVSNHYSFTPINYKRVRHQPGKQRWSPQSFAILLIITGSIMTSFALYYVQRYPIILLSIALGITVFYGAMLSRVKFKKIQPRHTLLLLLLTITAVIFWALFMLAPSVVTLFIERTQEYHWMAFRLPSTIFFGLCPLFTAILGLAFSMYLFYHRNHHRASNIIAKFVLGLLFTAAAFIILGLPHSNTALFYPRIIGFYLCLSAGELAISPIAASVITKLLPRKLEGVLIGFWFLCISIGSALSGWIAKCTLSATDIASHASIQVDYPLHFKQYALIALLFAALMMVAYLLFRLHEHKNPHFASAKSSS
jgi:POT family proton-dependent oligopeptide transporter